MAKYDRELLVTYLQDICALYIARSKIYKKVCQMDSTIDQLNVKKQYKKPKEPVKKDDVEYDPGLKPLWGAGAFFFAAMMILGLTQADGMKTALLFGAIFYACIGIAFFASERAGKREVEACNAEQEREYQCALAEYHQDLALYEKLTAKSEIEYTRNRAKRLALLDERNQLAKEHQTMGEMINSAYGVNIIPNQYRDKYAIVYLYDYFSGSRENDLALALNTYVLEQIKDRLDQVIRQLSEVILNQYEIIENQNAMINNQERAMELQKQCHAEMCAKLDRMILADEERNTYLDMIDSHVAAVGYFAAADYIRKI